MASPDRPRASRPNAGSNRPRPAAQPLPDYIYRRRRVAAVLVLVALVLGFVALVRVFTGGSTQADNSSLAAASSTLAPASTGEAGNAAANADGPKEGPAPANGEQTSAAATPGATEQAGAADPAASASPEPATPPPLKDSCALEDLIVTASVNRPSYDGQELPVFYMTVKNPTGADCTINLKDNPLRFEVYNMATNQRMWSDVDCNNSVDINTTRVFPADSERYYEATWSRTGSEMGMSAQQCRARTPVPAGSYYLHTVIGDNASQSEPFNLR